MAFSEGLQAIVTQSTICPAGSEALQSQTWLRKATQGVASIYPVNEPIDATYCVVWRSQICLRKALEPKGLIAGCSNSAWSPSLLSSDIIPEKKIH